MVAPPARLGNHDSTKSIPNLCKQVSAPAAREVLAGNLDGLPAGGVLRGSEARISRIATKTKRQQPFVAMIYLAVGTSKGVNSETPAGNGWQS
jgi:hypothetical protein